MATRDDSAGRDPGVAGGTGHALTLAHRIAPGRRAALGALLARVGGDIGGRHGIAFARLATVHFMRWVVIDCASDGGDGTLFFESNHDGSVAEHLDDLLAAGAEGLHEIYGHCAGYPVAASLTPAAHAAVKAFVAGGAIPYGAFHVGAHGRSVARIRLERDARAAIEAFVDRRRRQPDWPIGAAALYAEIRADLARAGWLGRLAQDLPPAPRVAIGRVVLGLARLLLPIAPLVLVPILPLLLWRRERADVEHDFPIDPAATSPLAAREDVLTQNQLTGLTVIKPGRFRRWLLGVVLRAIDVLAHFRFTEGHLGDITTIHFGRWVVVDQGRQLLFFSNYDGSWESYLGDFIDKATRGLTAVWSNTVGFPRTRWLVGGGARDEERFKAFTRAQQLVTPLWYSAYPDLTVRNILQNAAICRGVVAPAADEAGIERWLGLL